MQRLRKAAGKSAEEAAKYAGIAVATVYRIEAGTHSPKAADILALCRFYGVDDARSEVLATLARQSRQRGWWQDPRSEIPSWFEFYVGLEEEASELRAYYVEVIFGLLQTEDYIRAVMRADVTIPADDELERRISVRLKRQERLDGSDAMKLWVVLHEAALRCQVGGPEVMRAQLRHLIDLSWRNNVTLQVLPFTAGTHPASDGTFEILAFDEPADPKIAYIQYRRGSLYLEEPADLDAYEEAFDHLRARALSPDESRALIARVADETG